MKTKSIADLTTGYSDKDIPLKSYIGLVGIFSAWLGTLLFSELRQPSRLSTLKKSDLLVSGVAVHKLSRLITKDRVTSPFWAPFTKFVKSEGAGELEEYARGQGTQKAIGELVTCPFCIAPWVAIGVATGWAVAPRTTKAACGIFASVGIAHFLHHAYVAASESHSA